MSTEYVIASFDKAHRLTRTEAITACEKLGIHTFVSEREELEGKQIQDADVSIGCQTDCGTAWLNFNATDQLCGISVYCDTYNGGSAESLAQSLQVPVVDEHDNDYSKYNSGIDILTVKPVKVDGDWAFYKDEPWIVPYHVPSQGYYNHLARKVTSDEDWANLVTECVDEVS